MVILSSGCTTIEFNPERARVTHNREAARAVADGDYQKAEKRYRRAVAAAKAAPGTDHELLAAAQYNLGMFYLNRKRFSDATPALDAAFAIYQKQATPNQAALADVLTARGQLALNRSDFQGAEEIYLTALQAVSNAYDVSEGTRGRALMGIGHALRKQSFDDLANLYYWRAFPYLESAYGLRSPILKELLHYLSIVPPAPRRLDPQAAARAGVAISCPKGLTMARYPGPDGEVAQCETAQGESEQHLGTPQGLTTEWYPDGHMRQRGYWNYGAREGLVLEWHESGTLATAVEYRTGLKHGVQTDYDSDGRLLAQAHFLKSIQAGPAMSFFPNGLRRAAGNFAKGKADGKWTYFDETGEMIGSVLYRHGVEVPASRAR
jgi:tetratricopeptide (TPR) repeat protein